MSIDKVYEEVDRRADQDRSHIINKPWKDLPTIDIRYSSPDDRGTFRFLKAAMGELWKATESECGASNGCRLTHRKKKPDMFQCERGREWLHIDCQQGASTSTPKMDEGFFCTKHCKGERKIPVTSKSLKLYGTFRKLTLFFFLFLQERQNQER